MTIEELLSMLNRGIKNGSLKLEGKVMIRDLTVDSDAMEAGANGYKDLEEILSIDGSAFLLIEEL